MAQYPRKFQCGRGSELLYNPELHKDFEATRHLLDQPEGESVPKTQLDGALWLKRKNGDNELKTWDKAKGQFVNVFENKFQITDKILSPVAPANPVAGQLWIYCGVLCYYDGSQWKPVKAQESDASQLDLSIFNDHILVSPLWKQGNTVVIDSDIEEFMRQRSEYLQGKIDDKSAAMFTGNGEKWKLGDVIVLDPPDPEKVKLAGVCQFVVPDTKYERFFVDDKLDHNYQEESSVAIHYNKNFLLDKTPSMAHINPGKLEKIRKRLFLVDKEAPRIPVPHQNTEYYGFVYGDRRGHFLLQEGTQDDGGYVLDGNKGIYLSHDQAQKYDFVLTITFEFGSKTPNGVMRHCDNRGNEMSYYFPEMMAANSLFVEGLALEDFATREDAMSQTITVMENTSKLEVQSFQASTYEYGFVREVDLDGNAVFHVLHDFKEPLIFMNGEAMNISVGEVIYDRNNNLIKVANAKINMAWLVIDLYDTHDNYNMLESIGVISESKNVLLDDPKEREFQQGFIRYTSSEIGDGDLVLFVNGLVIKKQELEIDTEKKTISAPFLRTGQDFILLRDKYHHFKSTAEMMPAVDVAHLSESLVYHNGHLLLNSAPLSTTENAGKVLGTCAHNEIMHFIGDSVKAKDSFLVMNAETQTWDHLPKNFTVETMESMITAYANTTRSVAFDFEWNKTDDMLDIYAFNYSSDVENTMVIKSLPSEYDDPDSPYDEKNKPLREVVQGDAPELAPNGVHFFEKDIQAEINKTDSSLEPAARRAEAIKRLGQKDKYSLNLYHRIDLDTSYPQDIGALAVYVNGLRQYEVWEISPNSFGIPWPVRGKVTYTIELPERGASKVCSREVLDHTNASANTFNLYHTSIDLFPGRVVIYVDGVRQPEDSFIIVNNNTIMFVDKEQHLLGCRHNYPDELWVDLNDRPYVIHHTQSDHILVEVFPDYSWQESHTKLECRPDNFAIRLDSVGFPAQMLHSKDELKIYVDGLFMGLRRGDGYRVDRNRNMLNITSSDTVERMVTDPLYEALITNDEAMKFYIKNQNERMIHELANRTTLTYEEAESQLSSEGLLNQPYKPKTKDLIIEWR